MARWTVGVAALLVFAGCMGGRVDDASPETAAPTTNIEAEKTSRAAPTTTNVELFNETIPFARTPNSPAPSRSFTVPATASLLTLRWVAVLDCPAGAAYERELIVRDPADKPTSFYDSGTVAQYACMGDTPSGSEELELASGPWTLELKGTCTCSIRIIVAASVTS